MVKCDLNSTSGLGCRLSGMIQKKRGCGDRVAQGSAGEWSTRATELGVGEGSEIDQWTGLQDVEYV